MGISLSDDEVWDFLAEAHTGILTTLRRDGRPVSLPLWFVTFDRAVWFRTPAKTKKVTRVRSDPRACFLAEAGHAWKELKAVMMDGSVDVIDDLEVARSVNDELGRKYAGLAPDLGNAPKATKQHYGGGSAILRFTPGKVLSWDNARIRFPAPKAGG